MIRRWLPALLALVCVVALGAAPAVAAAPASFTRGAGLLPKLKHLGKTKMRIIVPKLPCTKKTPDASITVGMFGSLHRGQHVSSWMVGVRVSCSNGHRHAEGNFLNFANGGGIHVHVGDVVVLTQKGGMQYSVDDRTTGQGVGGVAGQGPGPTLRPSPKVLFGGRLLGHLKNPVTASVTNALVHNQPLGHKHWLGQQQVRANGKVVGDPGPLSKDGRMFPIVFN